jgi:hypothetical protein
MGNSTKESGSKLINSLTGYNREPNLLGALHVFRSFFPHSTEVNILVGGASPEELVSIWNNCKKLGLNPNLVGLNYNQGEVDRLKTILDQNGIPSGTFQLVYQDLLGSPYSGRNFNIALLNNVLGHLTNPQEQIKILNNLSQSLNIGGIFSMEKGSGLGFIGEKGTLPGRWARSIKSIVEGLKDGSLGFVEVTEKLPEGYSPKPNERYWMKVRNWELEG